MKIKAIPKLIALGLLKLYQLIFSPIFYFFGVRCRHSPSCSAYSVEAIQAHGVWVGGWLTLSRLYRCSPWGTHGVDNVPKMITKPPAWAPWRYGLWSRTYESIDDD